MRRRRYLGLAAGAVSGLAGCAARAFQGADRSGEPAPDVDCPAITGAARTVCPGSDGPLTVQRSGVSVSGASWSLVIAVTNRGPEPVGFSPSGWSLAERVDDGWRPVVPAAGPDPWSELRPDEPYAWELTSDGAAVDDVDQRVFLDLSPGTYAFAAPFRREERTAAVARFDVSV